jgi:ribonuclease P protein subunit POP4
MINSNNIFYHELIGLELEIVDSSNKSLIGLSGIVIDETKKTLKIETIKNEEKLIQKDVSIFHFLMPNGSKVEINGKILLNRPEDRIKKRYKKI